MFIPEIPNNSITKEIKKLTALCEKKIAEYGENSSWFKPPMIENDIQKWETENNIKFPTAYREWLLFSEESLIRNDLAHFYRLDDFKYNVIDVSPDLIVIGEIFGDGELICLSRSKNTFCIFDHGELEVQEDFRDILKEIIRILDEKSSLSPKMQDLLMQMVKDKK